MKKIGAQPSNFDELQYHEQLGSGRSCAVFRASCPKTAAQFAVKIIREHKKNRVDIQQEKEFFESNITHDNIIKCFQINENSLILEFMPNKELFDYIAFNPDDHLPIKLARFYSIQIVKALSHIHNSGFCHRDIKLENILLDENFNIKICDFGFTEKLSSPK